MKAFFGLRESRYHGDHGEILEAPLAGEGPVGGEPFDIVADGMAAAFEAAKVVVGGLMALEGSGIGVGE